MNWARARINDRKRKATRPLTWIHCLHWRRGCWARPETACYRTVPPRFPGAAWRTARLIEQAHVQKYGPRFRSRQYCYGGGRAWRAASACDAARRACDAGGRSGIYKTRTQAPFKLQLAGWLATLRANFHPQAAIFRHAVRLGLCIAIGDMIERSISWQPCLLAAHDNCSRPETRLHGYLQPGRPSIAWYVWRTGTCHGALPCAASVRTQ